jgi:acetyltransferase-like isoleucine patch superfamily enzyme
MYQTLDNIQADEYAIGRNCYVGERVTIRGMTQERIKHFVLGDNCRIEDDCRIYVDDFTAGDYLTLGNHCLVSGPKPLRLGHSIWVGQNTILNCTGGLSIGSGVGIGAYSQLWTHIKHGDTLQGCNWHSTKEMHIGKDAWFVGHVIVSPVHVEPRAMALAGSMIGKDMKENHVYGGCPAVDLTDKIGPQFREIPLHEKMQRARELLEEFHVRHPKHKRGMLEVIMDATEIADEHRTYFIVGERTYTKRHTDVEADFIRFIYPAKFFPRGDSDF